MNINKKYMKTINDDYGYFPKSRPKCCGREMYASGGTLGMRPDNKFGDIEHFWTCSICGQKVTDLIYNIII